MLINEFHKNLPEYYDTMFLDGYTPEQIMEAHHRTMTKKYYADQKRKQEEVTEERQWKQRSKSSLKRL